MSTSSTTALAGPSTGAIRSKPAGLAGLYAICFVSSMFGGIISTLMSVYLPVAVRDLIGTVSDKTFNDVSATINSVFLFGWMFGGIAWGLIGDRIGRARSVMLSTFWCGLFTVLTAAAGSWWLVTIFRFLAGFGVGGVIVTTTMMVSESWKGKARAVALGILSISIPVGIFSAGLINYLLPQWRLAFLTGIIPLLAAGVAMFLLTETDTWSNRERPAAAKLGFLSGQYRASLF
ncbi:MAG TPA: MFS transporter, partial [Puia sp.]|nr:MFS transporter [Puia sp.]